MRFTITTNQRTGHWVTAKALDGHPDISYAPYEPLQQCLGYICPVGGDEKAEKTWLQERNRLLGKAYGDKFTDWDLKQWTHIDKSRFFDEIWKQYNGFKITLCQMEAENPTWEYLHGLDDLKIIFLVRRNKLEQYISKVLANTTRIWHVPIDKTRLQSQLDATKVEIDTKDMVEWIRYWKERELEIAERFDDSRLLPIAYEEIEMDFSATIKKIQEFLGIKYHPLEPVFQKSNTIPMEERIINYEETKTAYEKCLDKCVCTVMSNGHYASSLTALQCMLRYTPDADGYIFVADHSTSNSHIKDKVEKLGIHVVDFSEIQKNDALAKSVQYVDHDHLRWASKPACLNHLLNRGYNRVLYADNDCHFVNKFNFLFEYLSDYGILLTPHWRSAYPLKNEYQFHHLCCHGVFNTGFVGVSQKGREALNYWSEACAWKCEINLFEGLYVDQKYMDIVPAMFSDICKVVDHRGCNVAGWNCDLNKRIEQEDGSVLINNKWPIIFFHFSWSHLEPWLKSYEDRYKEEVKKWDKWIGSAKKFSNILLDCGSNKLQGLNDLIRRHHIGNSWAIHTFEPNPFLEVKLPEELEITHHKVAIGTSSKIVSLGFDNENDEFANICGWFPKDGHQDVLQIDFAKFIRDNFDPDDHIVCKMNIVGSEYPVLQHLIKTGVINYFNKLYVEWYADQYPWPAWAAKKIRERCGKIKEEVEALPQYEEWAIKTTDPPSF